MRKAPLLLILLLGIYTIGLGQGFGVSGTVRNKNTLKPLSGAIVSMIGSDGSDIAHKTDTAGHYSFDSLRVKPNTAYILSADGRDLHYFPSADKTNICTRNATPHKIFVVDFQLQPGADIIRDRYPYEVFDKGVSTLTKSAKDSLAFLIKLLNDNPTIVIELDGHSCPSEGHNGVFFSQARADACRSYMISQGIDAARLVAKGWGNKTPMPGCSKDAINKMTRQAEKDSAEACDRIVFFRVLRFDYKSGEKK